jgi:hypothetical protein
MELQVKIYAISEINVVSNVFKKRDFIVETDEQYKNYLALQVNQDKCSMLDNYSVGQEVKVSVNLKGRLWKNAQGVEVAFNTLECWRIEKLQSESAETAFNVAENYNEKDYN